MSTAFVAVFCDREASFEPQAIPKRTRDVSGIEDKVLSICARGIGQRDIAETVEEVLFISMDGVSGLKEGAKSISRNVISAVLCI